MRSSGDQRPTFGHVANVEEDRNEIGIDAPERVCANRARPESGLHDVKRSLNLGQKRFDDCAVGRAIQSTVNKFEGTRKIRHKSIERRF